MPTRFTSQQLAASAEAGEPLTESSFSGDMHAWHTYQDAYFHTVTPGETLPPVGDSNRPKRWKAARRQRGKMEQQRARERDLPLPGGPAMTSANGRKAQRAGVSSDARNRAISAA